VSLGLGFQSSGGWARRLGVVRRDTVLEIVCGHDSGCAEGRSRASREERRRNSRGGLRRVKCSG
jgi:hypothetical protein